ncbi:MAG: DegV family protein [Candidatus Cryosericum sp.]|nr:DegV family protein [bacterium]
MIQVVMDTTTGMTKAEFEQAGITMIPLYIRDGDKLYREQIDIFPEEFYRRERQGAIFETAQTNPADLVSIFKPILEAGDEIVCVLISSAISGSVNAAHVAAQTLGAEDKITIVDSLESGYGEAYLGFTAKKMAEAGENRTEIVRALGDIRKRTRTYFIMESLKWLFHGGRLTGAQYFVGSVIKLNPIVWFDEAGRMISYDKTRTFKVAKDHMRQLVAEAGKHGVEAATLHWPDNLEEAQDFHAQMEEILQVPVSYTKLSCVLGVHTGPDLLGPCIVMKA